VIVFDASLALKWYFDEAGRDAAKGELARHGGAVVVPQVFVVEVTAALVRRANMDKALRSEMERSLAGFLALIAERFITVNATGTEDMEQAASLALDLGHPLKDCIYLALAMKMGCELLTSDLRFATRARGAWTKIRVLEG
jgi:predicted nucleic acid-binding protein